MDTIIEISTHDRKVELVEVIRKSFATVAKDFVLTIENAPTNAAFITIQSLTNSMDHGLIMYGYFDNNKIIGCVGIQDSQKDNIFYIERLGVLPENRHKNIGEKLLDFAFETIKFNSGKTASIGIMNENELLKNWYEKYGFKETGIKKFDHLPFTVCFMQKPIE